MKRLAPGADPVATPTQATGGGRWLMPNLPLALLPAPTWTRSVFIITRVVIGAAVNVTNVKKKKSYFVRIKQPQLPWGFDATFVVEGRVRIMSELP